MAIEETSLLNETYKTVVLKEYMNKVKNNVCLGRFVKCGVNSNFTSEAQRGTKFWLYSR